MPPERTRRLVGLTCIAATLMVTAGCAGTTTPTIHDSATSSLPDSQRGDVACVDRNPVIPAPVTPPIPGLSSTDELSRSWTLDGGQITVAPAIGVRPKIDRQHALCTLLAALDVNGFDVADDDSGLSLVLGRVTISDQLMRSPRGVAAQAAVQSPPPLTPFHSRLAWIAVIDPPLVSTCGTGGFASADPQPSARASERLVPYQLLAVDATTGDDGVVYEARTNGPCAPTQAFGPAVAPLMVNVSVPWRLVSRDPGGLFATIEVSVSSCDSYGGGANTSSTDVGLVESDVQRPIAGCGSPKKSDQILRGPTVSDPLPPTLAHAAVGYRDIEQPSATSGPVTAAALLCERAAPSGGVVAATYPATVEQLRAVHGGPPPAIFPFARQLASSAPDAPAAWCETKTGSTYTITAVGPDGRTLTGIAMTSATFVSLQDGPPPLP